jgi:hypothetical protein
MVPPLTRPSILRGEYDGHEPPIHGEIEALHAEVKSWTETEETLAA